MKEAIIQKDVSKEFYTQERCYITELSNTSDDPKLSIARVRVEHGITTCWHRLKGTSERYCIVSGRGRVEIGKLPAQEVKAGDVVFIPPMCRQRITNIGSEELIFLAICTPRFCDEVYQDIEEDLV